MHPLGSLQVLMGSTVRCGGARGMVMCVRGGVEGMCVRGGVEGIWATRATVRCKRQKHSLPPHHAHSHTHTTSTHAPVGTSCSAAATVASSTSSPLSPLSTAGKPNTVATLTEASRHDRRPTRCTSRQRSVPSSLPSQACPVPESTHSDLHGWRGSVVTWANQLHRYAGAVCTMTWGCAVVVHTHPHVCC